MTTKSLLFIGTLALASIASAKSYDIVLSAPAKAGAVQLSAGEYSLKVQGSNAVFTNVDTGKSFTAPVKSRQPTRSSKTQPSIPRSRTARTRSRPSNSAVPTPSSSSGSSFPHTL